MIRARTPEARHQPAAEVESSIRPDRQAGWPRSVTVAFFVWFATRCVLELIAAWSFRLDGHSAPWLHLWVQWDASYYLDAATNGYRMPAIVTGNETGQSSINFLPLLPLGIALIRFLVGSPVIAGLIFTNLCLVAAGVLLHRLTCRRAGVHAADWSVLSMMLLPGSFSLSGIMSEAPFLLLSIGAVTFARSRPAWGSLCLSLLAITRLTGIVLLAGVGLDWLIDRYRGRPATYRTLFLLALSPLPLLAYAAFMFHVTGDALAAVHSHSAFWFQKEELPFQELFSFVATGEQRLQVESVISLSMVAVLLTRWRLFTAGEWLFLAVSIGTSSSAVSLSPSLIRYMIALYPVHMAVGDLCSRWFGGRLLVCLYAMINGALVIGWAHGRDFFQ